MLEESEIIHVLEFHLDCRARCGANFQGDERPMGELAIWREGRGWIAAGGIRVEHVGDLGFALYVEGYHVLQRLSDADGEFCYIPRDSGPPLLPPAPFRGWRCIQSLPLAPGLIQGLERRIQDALENGEEPASGSDGCVETRGYPWRLFTDGIPWGEYPEDWCEKALEPHSLREVFLDACEAAFTPWGYYSRARRVESIMRRYEGSPYADDRYCGHAAWLDELLDVASCAGLPSPRRRAAVVAYTCGAHSFDLVGGATRTILRRFAREKELVFAKEFLLHVIDGGEITPRQVRETLDAALDVSSPQAAGHDAGSSIKPPSKRERRVIKKLLGRAGEIVPRSDIELAFSGKRHAATIMDRIKSKGWIFFVHDVDDASTGWVLPDDRAEEVRALLAHLPSRR